MCMTYPPAECVLRTPQIDPHLWHKNAVYQFRQRQGIDFEWKQSMHTHRKYQVLTYFCLRIWQLLWPQSSTIIATNGYLTSMQIYCKCCVD